ncbi:MAG TPA: 4-(cytidine 5'-diphospho)-2-C-methyl-D-erythritol kinase, partial [Burkholderiales bacterium]|nr:4-(cytidine 5'-diphospho)-2-C-methyl-D-erythritol kinase [Burkholderiales bacterium]
MRLRSCAKVNLGLEVVRKRSDGYHDIRTLFQSIDLADRIELEPTADGRIRLEGDDPSIAWDETNLVHRAARLVRERSGTEAGAFIRVSKAVPAGRGLGGGSANAAITLYGLNRLWSAGLGPGDLAGLALRLGSDVPYFLRGGLCLGESRGEALTPLADLARLPCVLAFPAYPIPTAEVYAGVGPSLTSEGKDSKIMRFLETGDLGLLENVLEHVILRRHPELEDLKRFFRGRGATLSLVTGSGSAVFGLFSG